MTETVIVSVGVGVLVVAALFGLLYLCGIGTGKK